MVDRHHTLPVASALTTSFYAGPQRPDDAQDLFAAACASAGFDRELDLPLRASRNVGAGLVLAREWGMTDLARRLAEGAEASFEPTWDRERGEFTWGLGLGEPHPRGQYNAFLAAAEAAGPGRWERLSTEPLEDCPQVVDVDFPEIALTRAEWDRGALHLTIAPRHEDPDAWTEFRIDKVEPRLWYLTGIDRATMDVRPDCVVVRTPRVAGNLEFTPGSY